MLLAFDVDGTLTPSRQPMDTVFKTWWFSNMTLRRYILVTGSDYQKTREQLGDKICLMAERVFCCAGNSVWERGREVRAADWQPDTTLMKYLTWITETSDYPIKAGNHIELRPGMINISTVGRNCTSAQRYDYWVWDQQHKERQRLVQKIETSFPELQCQIGGEISVDIYPRGRDKSQVLHWYPAEEIVFFGDGMEPGKNDWALAEVLQPPSQSIAVASWTDTYRYLQEKLS
jgi:phosphomannomutase